MSNPSHRFLLGLIIFITAVFVGQLIFPVFFTQWESTPANYKKTWEVITAGKASATQWLGLSQLFTASLLHGGLAHLLFNMLFLWIFAGLVGESLGTRWMMAIFAITAVAGYIGDAILRAGSPIPALGASGAVMGFEGAYLGLAVRWSLPWPQIWPIAYPIPPMNLVIIAAAGFMIDISGTINGGGNTAYGAHLGGFLVGLFLTSFIAPAPRELRT